MTSADGHLAANPRKEMAAKLIGRADYFRNQKSLPYGKLPKKGARCANLVHSHSLFRVRRKASVSSRDSEAKLAVHVARKV